MKLIEKIEGEQIKKQVPFHVGDSVKVHTRVLNQDGVLVAEFKRLVLVPRRNPGTELAEGDVD